MINPFKGVGDLNKLRQEASKIQNELKKIEVTKEKGKTSAVVTGDLKVKSIKINGEEQFDLKDALNDAIEKAQKEAAHKMQSMGGLQGLLG